MTGSNSVNKSSLILPVWISHRDNPDNELLIYALLDTQSDTTFVIDDTCQALGVEGLKTQLILSTIFAKNQVIDSNRVEGLLVRGHDSALKIPRPVSYTRSSIPVNRAHIPTPDMARQWSHLYHIADKLLPMSECDVSLLVGYDCSRALLPREVIAPTNNGPYAQRTDLSLVHNVKNLS